MPNKNRWTTHRTCKTRQISVNENKNYINNMEKMWNVREGNDSKRKFGHFDVTIGKIFISYLVAAMLRSNTCTRPYWSWKSSFIGHMKREVCTDVCSTFDGNLFSEGAGGGEEEAEGAREITSSLAHISLLSIQVTSLCIVALSMDYTTSISLASSTLRPMSACSVLLDERLVLCRCWPGC